MCAITAGNDPFRYLFNSTIHIDTETLRLTTPSRHWELLCSICPPFDRNISIILLKAELTGQQSSNYWTIMPISQWIEACLMTGHQVYADMPCLKCTIAAQLAILTRLPTFDATRDDFCKFIDAFLITRVLVECLKNHFGCIPCAAYSSFHWAASKSIFEFSPLDVHG